MPDGSVVVKIGGRDALPVRAIPFVTGWKVSPDVVAKRLARQGDALDQALESLVAYHLAGAAPVKMLPKEWDLACVNLDALSERLDRQYPVPRGQIRPDAESYAEWRRESPALLPPSTFVWFDEFKLAFEADFGPHRLTIIDEREGDRDLVLSPMLAGGQIEMILEGFTAIQVHSRPSENVPGIGFGRASPAPSRGESNRVVIQDFAWKVALALADKNASEWAQPDDDDPMRRTILAAMNQHRWQPDGIPGVLPFIYKLLEHGQIKVFGTLDGLPFVDVAEVQANPVNWYMSQADADFVVNALMGVAENRAYAEREADRARERMALDGRYTLEEAAATLERHTGERANELQKKLIESVRTGVLPVHEPDKNARYVNDTVRWFYEQAFWDDLNHWIAAYEPRIAWRFPQPGMPTESDLWAIEYNFSREVEWDLRADYSSMAARDAILLIHGLNPEAYDGTLPPRVMNDERAKVFFANVAHRVAVAKAEVQIELSASAWMEWVVERGWKVHARFRTMAEAKALTPALTEQATPLPAENHQDSIQGNGQHSAESHARWWDETMDASGWWTRDNVKFFEAAMLLCGHNPLETDERDAERATMYDSTAADGKLREFAPIDFKRLRGAFDAKVHTESDRTLEYWLDLAQAKNLRYHGWIDQWLVGKGIETSSDQQITSSEVAADGAQAGVDVLKSPTSGGVSPVENDDQPLNWKMAIQAEAAKRWIRARSSGANPTKHNMKSELAAWCRTAGVMTPGGIFPDAEYIRRHVLNAWTPPDTY